MVAFFYIGKGRSGGGQGGSFGGLGWCLHSGLFDVMMVSGME